MLEQVKRRKRTKKYRVRYRKKWQTRVREDNDRGERVEENSKKIESGKRRKWPKEGKRGRRKKIRDNRES